MPFLQFSEDWLIQWKSCKIEPLAKVSGGFFLDGGRKGYLEFKQPLNEYKSPEAHLFDKISSHHHHSGQSTNIRTSGTRRRHVPQRQRQNKRCYQVRNLSN